MSKGFYAGSFDPFTIGHLDLITKSAKLFDELVVGIGNNKEKKRRFNKNDMKTAMEKIMQEEGLNNVKIIIFDNFSVDAAVENKCDILIRGVRNAMDYAYEENLALTNEELSGLDTIFIRSGNIRFISSSMVRELLNYQKDISKYVPKEILKLIKQ